MSVRIRCPHCHRYFAAPDLESVKVYAAAGGLIQTLTERIVAQPIHRHYVTPAPVLCAATLVLPLVFLAPGLTLYFNVNPMVSGTILVTSASALFVWASSQIEMTETDEMQADEDDEPEAEQQIGPAPLIEVGRPFKNSMTIKWTHEPPSNPDPVRQLNLGKADLALARLATGVNPISPISFAEAKRRGYKAGEPTFYEVQRRWIAEALAFRSNGGAVYLRESGRRILARYAQQEE